MGALIVLLVLAVVWAYRAAWRGDRAVQAATRDAANRWAEQNRAVDAERACACGALGEVRHASVAIGGSYVWWSCWEHRWANGPVGRWLGDHVYIGGATFNGPGLPEEGVAAHEYYRWYPVQRLGDGTWQHEHTPLTVPLDDDYQPGAA